jgi:hypothetical protein
MGKGQGGSERVESTRCSVAGRCSTRNAVPSYVRVRDEVVVLQDEHGLARHGCQMIEQPRQQRLVSQYGHCLGVELEL